MKRFIVMAAVASFAGTIAVAGCTALGIAAPKTPAQAVYVAKSDFLAAVLIADEYKKLPECDGTIQLCKSQGVVDKIKLGANAAKATLDAAQATVTDPAFKGGTDDQAVVAAVNAVGAFQSITQQLKVNHDAG